MVLRSSSELNLTDSNLLGGGLIQRGHTGTGQGRCGRTVGHRLNQATGRIRTASVRNQEARERRVTGTHSATHLNRLVHGVPDTFLGHEHRAAAAQGGQHVLDAVAKQLLSGAGGQLGAGLQLLPIIATGQLG